MPITSLSITNFQAHQKLDVDLDPTVTTIVGPSDVGKSSLIRAFRWTCLNVPVSSLIREGAKTATVGLTVDGRCIGRQRGTENIYSLDGNEFRAFRTDVPDAIFSVLNVSEINFQCQHDAIFGFSSTPGDISRQLNAVVDLAIIDSTLTEITRTFHKARTVLQIAEESLSKSVAERDSLVWVSTCDAELKAVEEKETLASQIRFRVDELSDRLETLEAAAKETVKAKEILRDSIRILEAARKAGMLGKLVVEVGEVVSAARKAKEEKDKPVPDITVLASCIEGITLLRKRVTSLDDAVADAEDKKGKKNSPIPDISELSGFVEKIVELRKQGAVLWGMIEDAEDKKESLRSAKKAFDDEHRKYDEAVGNRCPLCGKEIE